MGARRARLRILRRHVVESAERASEKRREISDRSLNVGGGGSVVCVGGGGWGGWRTEEGATADTVCDGHRDLGVVRVARAIYAGTCREIRPRARSAAGAEAAARSSRRHGENVVLRLRTFVYVCVYNIIWHAHALVISHRPFAETARPRIPGDRKAMCRCEDLQVRRVCPYDRDFKQLVNCLDCDFNCDNDRYRRGESIRTIANSRRESKGGRRQLPPRKQK